MYPEDEHREKVLGFTSQLVVWRGFMAEPEKRQDTYLRHLSASKIVLFAARLVLAQDRILYPHKWLITYVLRADNKPDDFIALAEALLDNPRPESSDRFFDSLLQWPGWEELPHNVFGRFVQECEWNWRDRRPPLEDA